MITVAICDDSPQDVAEIKDIIDNFFAKSSTKAETDVFTGGEDFLAQFSNGRVYDLVFLDILMPGMNGMEIASRIREQNNGCAIVFMTSSADYAVQSYGVRASDYLLKPIDETRVKEVLKSVMSRTPDIGRHIGLKYHGVRIELCVDDIVYVESSNRNLAFHLKSGKIVTASGRVDDYSPVLCVFPEFVRCHKSYLVNMNFAQTIQDECFVLKDHSRVKISRQYYSSTKKAYFTFIFNKGDVIEA